MTVLIRNMCRAAVERLGGSGVRQLAIVPYGVGDADRAAALKSFVAAATA